MASIKSINVLLTPILACFSEQKRIVQVLIRQYFLSLVQNEIGGSGLTCSYRIPGDGIECDLDLETKARSISGLGNAHGTRKPIRSKLLPPSHQSGMSHSALQRETVTGNRYPLATLWRDADGHDFQRQISRRKSFYTSEFCRWNKTEWVLQVRLGNVKRRQGIVTLWQQFEETRMGTIFSVRSVGASRLIPVSFVAGTKRNRCFKFGLETSTDTRESLPSGETQMGTIFSVRTVCTSRYIPVSFVAGTKRDVRLNSTL
jgi:hypothetical protein